MKNKIFYLFLSIIFVLNIGMLLLYFNNKYLSKSLSNSLIESNKVLDDLLRKNMNSILEYGENSPYFNVKTLDGNRISVDNTHKGILYINFLTPDTMQSIGRYYKFLSEQVLRYKEKEYKINLLCVSLGKLIDTKDFINRYKLDFEFVVNDIYNLNEKFNINRSSGTIVINNGKIDFYKSGRIDQLLTRQLLEKYFKYE